MPRFGKAELALDDVERHAFASEFDGVGVAQLVRRKAPPHTGLGGKPAELDPPLRSTRTGREWGRR